MLQTSPDRALTHHPSLSLAPSQLSNISDVTGQQERIELYSALLRDGSLFYALGVVLRAQFSDYQTFRQVVGSIRIMD